MTTTPTHHADFVRYCGSMPECHGLTYTVEPDPYYGGRFLLTPTNPAEPTLRNVRRESFQRIVLPLMGNFTD